MAQAQKLVGLAGIERFAQFVGQTVATTADPAVLDGVDIDRLIETYGDITGVPPDIMRPKEIRDQIRGARAQQQQAAQRQAAISTSAKAARDLAKSPMDEDNALTSLLDQSRAGQLVEAYT
jgi:hypothetical protein